MSWSQIYDDDETLKDVRARVRRLVVAFALASGALVSAAPLSTVIGGADAALTATLCGTLLAITAGAVMVQLAREHRRIWRIELSMRQATGYDAAGRRRTLAWPDVEAVDVTEAGLVIAGLDASSGARVRLLAPLGMTTYTALSHRAVEYAEAHRRPVRIDGVPIDQIDLARLDASLCASHAL